MKAEDRSSLSSLCRWYDHLHFCAVSAGAGSSLVADKFPAVQLSKVPFRMPPPAAPVNKAAKGKDKSASKDKPTSASSPALAPAEKLSLPASEEATPETDAASPAAKGIDPELAAKNAAKRKERAEKKAKKEKPPPPPKAAASVSALNIRVGKVISAENHPDADKLYVETVDVGEAEPRTIVSGLRLFVPLETMQGRMVVVLTNLKPAKMVGIASAGMVLCASNEDHSKVEPLAPPEGAVVGERVMFEGHPGEAEAQLNPKKKIFEELAPKLTTDATGQAQYDGTSFMTSAGPVTAGIVNASVK